jgi:hypothetical protein
MNRMQACFTKPWPAEVMYLEGRLGGQRLVDLEGPFIGVAASAAGEQLP